MELPGGNVREAPKYFPLIKPLEKLQQKLFENCPGKPQGLFGKILEETLDGIP